MKFNSTRPETLQAQTIRLQPEPKATKGGKHPGPWTSNSHRTTTERSSVNPGSVVGFVKVQAV